MIDKSNVIKEISIKAYIRTMEEKEKKLADKANKVKQVRDKNNT